MSGVAVNEVFALLFAIISFLSKSGKKKAEIKISAFSFFATIKILTFFVGLFKKSVDNNVFRLIGSKTESLKL